jgi:hypothetical protein|tara:strand:+ start:40 stop:309 length:270 start_codon:yes stop_codon:yes gene_type:complete
MIDNPDEWVGMGVWHLQTSISIMNLLINNDLVDLGVMKTLIEEKAQQSGSVNEQALWETYKDFLDPMINTSLQEPPQNVIRFPEGEDFV